MFRDTDILPYNTYTHVNNGSQTCSFLDHIAMSDVLSESTVDCHTLQDVVVVVVVPQRVCPSKPAPLSKHKQLAGECHKSSGLLMLFCVLMCVSAEQWVIMCVRLGYGCQCYSVCRLRRWNRLFSLVSCQSSVMSAMKPAEVYSVKCVLWCTRVDV